MFSSVAPPLFSYRKFWAHRLGPAPFLPMSSDEMEGLGWDSCDIILVTGDAYVDHPSFGMAVIGRLLEAQGFRVGIIAQPAWQSAAPFTALGRPNLFFGVTAGNMDSMVNRYTADGLPRSDDAYSPGGISNLRPDRASIVYAQRCREAYREVPVVIGGIEASLRRLAHYDYWSDKVRRSILLDCKADLLLYGNAERALVELAHRLSQRTAIGDIKGLRGTAYASTEYPTKLVELDMRDPYNIPASPKDRANTVVRLPDYDQVKSNPALYAHASRQIHLESNPYNARALMQLHGARQVMVTPPPLPLTTSELDQIYELPYQRRPHPSYGEQRIPAYEMIRFSIPIMRGCFGGCTFCSITEHEGRIVQNRSDESILREVEIIRDTTPGFTGTISDLGGPTANMYDLGCGSPRLEAACRRLSCLHPRICPNLKTSHKKLTRLYSLVRETSGVKRVLVASGVRYDLATEDPEYVRALAQHHVGGYLKVAPEHSEPQSLALMMKPAISAYHRFKELFDRYSQQAGKEQYLIPYFIAAHPGTTDMEMVRLAQWLKRQRLRLEQVQTFLPTPMALATTMYHTGFNPLKPIAGQQRSIYTAKGLKQRRLHKAMLRYHDPQNWPLLRGALKRLKHEELIGRGRDTLVPAATKRAGQSQWSTDNSRRKKRR